MRPKGCNTHPKGDSVCLMLSSGCSTLPIQCKNHNFSVAATATVGMCIQNHKFCRVMDTTAPPSVPTSGKIQFKGLLPQN